MSGRFFRYKKGSIGNARRLRRNSTEAEQLLWSQLRGNRLGVHFRRQVPVGRYIVDFLCIKANLVLEVDGGQHYKPAGRARDAIRDEFLRSEGLHVERFSNTDVYTNTDGVIERILEILHNPLEGDGKSGANESCV